MNKNEDKAGASIEVKGCNVKLTLSDKELAHEAFNLSEVRSDQVSVFLSKVLEEVNSISAVAQKVAEFAASDNEFAFMMYCAGRRMGIKEGLVKQMRFLASALKG